MVCAQSVNNRHRVKHQIHMHRWILTLSLYDLRYQRYCQLSLEPSEN